MRYFVPDIRAPRPSEPEKAGLFRRVLGRPPEAAAPAPAPGERLGGRPWGLSSDRWPKCSECGKSQSLLAQFEHHPDRLDLGREGRVLFVFQCAHDPGMCATWEAFSGANACFVVEPEHIEAKTTELPGDAPPVDPEVLVDDWTMKDDGLSTDLAEAFHSEQTFLKVSEEMLRKVTWSTRLGGLPRWMQSPDEAPKPGWRFVGQLDGAYSFLSPPTPCPAWVSPDPEAFEGRTHVATGPNFGGGLAYLFLRDGDQRPDGCMFWQR